jgi:SagB-type dehydrogenase family enzyme
VPSSLQKGRALDDARTFPLVIGSIVSGTGDRAGQLLFTGLGQESFLVIKSYVPEISKLLPYINGKTSVEDICKNAGVEPSLAKGLLQLLFQQKVWVEASRVGEVLHELTQNPPCYPRHITTDEIAALTATPDWGLQGGTVVARCTELPNTGLAALVRARSSTRSFQASPLEGTLVARLLVQAYSGTARSVASAGGLYPLRIYFALMTDHDVLPAGLYQFDPSRTEIRKVGELPHKQEAMFAFNSSTCIHDAPLIVVIAASPDRHVQKYGNRGVAFTGFEVGAVAHTLQLGAQEAQLGSLIYGGFNAQAVAALFGMDPERSLPQLAVAIGRKSDQPSDDLAAQAVRLESAMARVAPVVTQGIYPEPIGGYQARVTFKGHTGAGSASNSDEALVAAMAETFERFATARFNRVDTVASAYQLDSWLNPVVVAPLTAQQYVHNPSLEPFNPEKPIEWVRGKSWATGDNIWVPFDLVGYNVAQFGRKPCIQNNSSGVAAHTTWQEAARRGLLELIERDALMRHWLTRRVPGKIRPNDLPRFLRRRIKQLELQGRGVSVLNFSHGAHGMAVIGVAIYGDEFPGFTLGMAASDTDWQAAAIKAFREADQSGGAAEMRTLKPQQVQRIMDHGDLFAQPEFARQVSWLYTGGYGPPPNPQPLALAIAELLPVVVELGQAGDPLVVVRVLCDNLVPISFGYGMDYYTHRNLRDQVKNQPDLPIPFA